MASSLFRILSRFVNLKFRTSDQLLPWQSIKLISEYVLFISWEILAKTYLKRNMTTSEKCWPSMESPASWITDCGNSKKPLTKIQNWLISRCVLVAEIIKSMMLFDFPFDIPHIKLHISICGFSVFILMDAEIQPEQSK